jgi:hypothetical protein
VHSLQRRLPLRRAARVRAARGRGKLVTGHYARIVERDGQLFLARAPIPAKDQSYMLASLDPKKLARVSFPARRAGQGRDPRRGRARRARRRRAGPRARRRASSPATTTAASSGGRARADRRRDRRRGRERARPATTASGGSRPASGAASASRPGAALRPRQPSRANAVVVGPRESLARTASTRAAASTRRRARRGEAPLPLARGAGARRADGRGFRLELDEPAYGVAPGQAACSTTGRPSSDTA